MENTMKMYITADEVAELLGVSRGYWKMRKKSWVLKENELENHGIGNLMKS